MEFPGVLKKKQVEFLGVNSKQRGICRGGQEKIMRNFQGRGLDFWKFPRNITQFCGVSGSEALCLEFPGI